VRPNVLLIVLDTARADAFEPYGARAGASPVLADLARRGQVSRSMFAPASWTLPSHASFFTGLLPRATGLMQAPDGPPACRGRMEAQRDRLLPEVLRRAGFETRAASANLWVSEITGFATGFDRFSSVDSGRQTKMHEKGRRSRLSWNIEGLRARVDDGAAEVGSVLRTWMSEPRSQPFFWFVNLVECHSPYLPPRPYDHLGPLGRWRAADEARRYLTLEAIWRACAGGLDVPEDALARMRDLYAGAIRYLDDWLGSTLDALDASGLLDDTLVIVTSDHGENFGEDGLMGHAFSLDDRLLRVPFVAAGPGAFAPKEAESLAALPRLIAEAVGVQEHPWAPTGPEGVAVAQFDPPAGPDDPRWHQALSDWGLGEDALPRVTSEITSSTDGRLKLVRHGDRTMIFDLERDPLESAPLDPDELAATTGHLSAALEHASATIASPAAEFMPTDEISDAEREHLEDRMRLLGYL
jgi:arylsulfatase A-like enzyme